MIRTQAEEQMIRDFVKVSTFLGWEFNCYERRGGGWIYMLTCPGKKPKEFRGKFTLTEWLKDQLYCYIAAN